MKAKLFALILISTFLAVGGIAQAGEHRDGGKGHCRADTCKRFEHSPTSPPQPEPRPEPESQPEPTPQPQAEPQPTPPTPPVVEPVAATTNTNVSEAPAFAGKGGWNE